MKIILIPLTTLFIVFCRCENQTCSKIIPQKHSNWSKLTGEWYQLMYIPTEPTSFTSCRKMQISNVDSTAKILDFDFFIISYKSVGKRSVYFQWFDNPGVIYTAVRHEFQKHKQASKPSLWKKATRENNTQSKEQRGPGYTLISSDYSNYLILIQCKYGETPLVWVLMKTTTPDQQLIDEIKTNISSTGIDALSLNFNSATICPNGQQYI